jgi:hypothetical protein
MAPAASSRCPACQQPCRQLHMAAQFAAQLLHAAAQQARASKGLNRVNLPAACAATHTLCACQQRQAAATRPTRSGGCAAALHHGTTAAEHSVPQTRLHSSHRSRPPATSGTPPAPSKTHPQPACTACTACTAHFLGSNTMCLARLAFCSSVSSASSTTAAAAGAAAAAAALLVPAAANRAALACSFSSLGTPAAAAFSAAKRAARCFFFSSSSWRSAGAEARRQGQRQARVRVDGREACSHHRKPGIQAFRRAGMQAASHASMQACSQPPHRTLGSTKSPPHPSPPAPCRSSARSGPSLP